MAIGAGEGADTMRDPVDALIARAEDLVDAVTFDDSGTHGQGGNGGLLSRETIRKADALRLAICAARPKPSSEPPRAC